MRTVDQCLTDTALNVTLQALFAVHIITQHLFRPVRMDEFRVYRAFVRDSYIMAMLNTIYDTPTCSPNDDGSTNYQSISLNINPI